jgi:hypothetical protein
VVSYDLEVTVSSKKDPENTKIILRLIPCLRPKNDGGFSSIEDAAAAVSRIINSGVPSTLG